MASFWDSIVDLAGKYGPDLINAYTSYNAGKSASKKAGVASGQEESLRGQSLDVRNRQLGLAENADARSQQLFDDFGSSFLPAQREGVNAQRQVLSEASRKIDPNVEAGLASADYASAEATARGTRQRQQQAVGVDPNSGAALEGERLAGLDATAGRAAAATNARRSAETTRLSRMSAAAQPLTNAGMGLVSASGGFATAANTGANQAAAGLSDLAGDYGADASQASAVAGKAGSSLGESLSDGIQKIFDDYKAQQAAALQPVTPTVKPLPIMDGQTGTFNAAGGAATGGTKSFGYDMEGTSAKIGMPDGYDFLGGKAKISTGLADLDYGKLWGGMTDAELSHALGTEGAMKAIDGAGGSTLSRVSGGVGGALDIVSGIKQGGIQGTAQAAGGAAQVASAAGIGGSALSTIATGAGYAGLAIAAGQAIHNSVNGRGDELRNEGAFLQKMGAKEVRYKVGGKGGAAGRFYQLADGRVLSVDNFDKLAGAWYGAVAAPDGDRQRWQQEYERLNASLVSDPWVQGKQQI